MTSRKCLLCGNDVPGEHLKICRLCVRRLLADGLDDQVLTDLYDRLDRSEPVVSNTHSNATFSDVFLDWLEAHANPQARIVEVGSGGGFLADAIYRRGFCRIVATDFSSSAVDVMKARFPHLDCRIMAANDLQFEDDSLDVVISVETIEHLLNPRQHLCEAHRVLKVGGTYLIRTPNWLASTIYYRLTGHHDIAIWHPSVFNSQGLTRALRRVGYSVTHISPRSLPVSQIKKLPRPVRPLRWIPLRLVPRLLRPSVICAATKK